jgi:hypothetical protein
VYFCAVGIHRLGCDADPSAHAVDPVVELRISLERLRRLREDHVSRLQIGVTCERLDGFGTAIQRPGERREFIHGRPRS